MGRRKLHRIRIKEDRLENLDTVKFEVAAWLMARQIVEDKTRRSQPKPVKHEEVVDQVVSKDREDAERPEEAT